MREIPPFVVLGGDVSGDRPPAPESQQDCHPALDRVARDMYLERLDYEPSIKQLRRMAKFRSVSGPFKLSPTEQAAVRKRREARRHSFAGGWDVPQPRVPRTARHVAVTGRPSEQQPVGSPDARLVAEADALIAALHESINKKRAPSGGQIATVGSKAASRRPRTEATPLDNITSPRKGSAPQFGMYSVGDREPLPENSVCGS
mmetsp:Transcript_22628/g.57945  ORF Transcript_22628/g.57945 Transcript_22628/m.57945 type:complete len:203 (-) Transcript_22628:42-650(-)